MDLIARLQDALQKRSQRRGTYQKSSHSAWDIGACERALFYRWTNEAETNPRPAFVALKGMIGDAVHAEVGRLIAQARVFAILELSGDKQLEGLQHPFYYRSDLQFIDDGDNAVAQHFDIAGPDRAGADIKTSFGQYIAYIKRNDRPKPDDVAQVAAYMGLERLRAYYLYYIAYDSGFQAQFDFLVHEGILWCAPHGNPAATWNTGVSFRDLVAKLARVEAFVDLGKEPERPYRVAIKKGQIKDSFTKDGKVYDSDWQCMRCNYLALCQGPRVKDFADSDNAHEFDNPRPKEISKTKWEAQNERHEQRADDQVDQPAVEDNSQGQVQQASDGAGVVAGTQSAGSG